MTRPGPAEEPHVEEDDRVVRALRGAWAPQGEPDRAALWRAVESRLGPQDVPWYVRWRALAMAAIVVPGRRLALAGVAVLLVGALFLSGLFGNGDPASAAVLEQVTALSARTDAALADGVLSADEVADLRSRALALLDEVRSDDRALGQLSPAQLKLVVDTLTLVGGDLQGFVAESSPDEGLVEAVASIRETTTRATDLRRERGDDREGGDDERDATPSAGNTPTGVTSTPEAEETHEAEETPETEGPLEDDGEHETEGTPTPAAEATSTTRDTTVTIPAVAGAYTYAAADAGAVTFSFDGKRLALVSVSEAAGWTGEVDEASGSEVRVRFQSGEDRITFEVDVLDAALSIRVREGSFESGEPDD